MLSLRDFSFQGQKVVSSQLFCTDQEQQKEVRGDICLSKQSLCVASSDLLVLGWSIWGVGNASPPCQQPTNSHLRLYQSINSQAVGLKKAFSDNLHLCTPTLKRFKYNLHNCNRFRCSREAICK